MTCPSPPLGRRLTHSQHRGEVSGTCFERFWSTARQGAGSTGAGSGGGWLGGSQEGRPCRSWLCPRANQCSELGFPAPQKLATPCLGLMLPPAEGLHYRAYLGWALGLSMPTWTVNLADTCWVPWAQRAPPAAPQARQNPGPVCPSCPLTTHRGSSTVSCLLFAQRK